MSRMNICFNKVSAKIVDDMLLNLLFLLNQHHANSLLGCDHIYKKFMAIVGWTKHGGRCQGFLQIIKRLLGSLISDKWSVFLQQTHEASGKIGKINCESSQEFHHTLQTMKMSNVMHGRQLKYFLNLQGIHSNTLLRHDGS